MAFCGRWFVWYGRLQAHVHVWERGVEVCVHEATGEAGPFRERVWWVPVQLKCWEGGIVVCVAKVSV